MTPAKALKLLFCIVLVAALNLNAQTTDLSGEGWNFAIDTLCRGEASGWHQPTTNWDGTKPHPQVGWDQVSVPHDFLTDPRYAFTGVAWYRRSFKAPEGKLEDRSWLLRFDSVFQRCRVWVNGKMAGSHDGGYLPFDMPISGMLLAGRQNLVVVEVDNRVKFRALPGARTGTNPNASQYPWLNYGGILGRVRLIGVDQVRVESQKIETVLSNDYWRVNIRAEIRNDTAQPASGKVIARISPGAAAFFGNYIVPAMSSRITVLSGAVAEGSVKPWNLENPAVYGCSISLEGSAEATEAVFGFREVQVQNAALLLNGNATRLGGANRARGHPVYGGLDPDEAVVKDLTMMRDAGLVFARLQHTPPGRNLLDWADRNGMLIVLENGMWGYTSEDQASAELRRTFQANMRELIRFAQNHPSVIGWSIGNEYESWTAEGVAWTRDMARFVKGLDSTRPVTFAALGTALRKIKEEGSSKGEHAFDYVDYISANFYFQPEELPDFLDPVHARWAGKPVAITEFGLRADTTRDENKRIAHFDSMLKLVSARAWICGLSYWSFNDYASRYPGTGPDGYRRWGLVDEFRKPRELYKHVAPILKDGIPSKP